MLRRHAKRRASERYGIHLNKYLRREIIAIIQAGESVWKRRSSRTRSIHIVEKDGLGWFAVVYSHTLKDIVTVLPATAWQIEDYFKEGQNGTNCNPTLPALREGAEAESEHPPLPE